MKKRFIALFIALFIIATCLAIPVVADSSIVSTGRSFNDDTALWDGYCSSGNYYYIVKVDENCLSDKGATTYNYYLFDKSLFNANNLTIQYEVTTSHYSLIGNYFPQVSKYMRVTCYNDGTINTSSFYVTTSSSNFSDTWFYNIPCSGISSTYDDSQVLLSQSFFYTNIPVKQCGNFRIREESVGIRPFNDGEQLKINCLSINGGIHQYTFASDGNSGFIGYDKDDLQIVVGEKEVTCSRCGKVGKLNESLWYLVGGQYVCGDCMSGATGEEMGTHYCEICGDIANIECDGHWFCQRDYLYYIRMKHQSDDADDNWIDDALGGDTFQEIDTGTAWINDIINGLGHIWDYIIVALGTAVTVCQSFLKFLSSTFTFLPKELIALITISIPIALILRILGR